MGRKTFGVKHPMSGIAFGIAIACAISPFGAAAAVIHKCLGPVSTAYQTTPCNAGQREIALLSIPGSEAKGPPRLETSGGLSTAGGTVTGDDGRWLPFGRRRLIAGMRDDEVLNAPDGGVPTRITRTRDGRTWREVWFYERRKGRGEALQFVNGRLMSIVDAEAGPASVQTAALAP